MAEKALHLEIITPQRTVYRAEATRLTAPGIIGSFQVLFNHAPLLSAIGIGELRVKAPDGVDTSYATSGGFVEVCDNNVVVLVETAEQAADIDVDRARKSRDRAATRLRTKSPDIDVGRAQASLMRALNRLRIAERR